MQAIKKLKTTLGIEAIKEMLIIVVSAAVGYKLIFTCSGLFRLTLGELFDTAMGRATPMWERSVIDVLCILVLLIAFLGISLVLADAVKRLVTACLKKD